MREDPATSDGDALIHETAIVEVGASVGVGTRIWHHVHIRAGAHIGVDCTLGKNVFVDQGVQIGDRVKIQNNVSVFRGVELADEVFVGPAAVFTNDRRPRAVGRWEVIPTFVSHGATIGANATVLCGVTVGAWAMIGAGSVVTHSVEDNELVVGVPARHSGWVCRCGAVVSRAESVPEQLSCGSCEGSNT